MFREDVDTQNYYGTTIVRSFSFSAISDAQLLTDTTPTSTDTNDCQKTIGCPKWRKFLKVAFKACTITKMVSTSNAEVQKFQSALVVNMILCRFG